MKKNNKSKVMSRAWEIFKNKAMGYATFGEALSDSWAEAKGLLTICEAPVVVTRNEMDEAVQAMVRTGMELLANVAG